MENKKQFDEFKKELKARNRKEFPVYKAIYVEEHDRIRELIGKRLIELGNSCKDFKIEFTILKYNFKIPAELVKNCTTDLVILDLDQQFSDPLNTVDQIRSFGWHTPIIFSSVEINTAQKTLARLSAMDLAVSKQYMETSNSLSLEKSLIKINDYLISLNNITKKQYKLERLLFPTLNHLIYHSSDKFSLYTSRASRTIPTLIKKAKAIKQLVESIIKPNDKEEKKE